MSELKFLSFSLILYVKEIQILAVQIDSICKGLYILSESLRLHLLPVTFAQALEYASLRRK